MPRLVRYLMEGLGTPDAQSADLMSYLLFDSAYTGTLVEIGYRDTTARIDEIEAFLHPGNGETAAERSSRRRLAGKADRRTGTRRRATGGVSASGRPG